jgi:hypothetical protein
LFSFRRGLGFDHEAEQHSIDRMEEIASLASSLRASFRVQVLSKTTVLNGNGSAGSGFP